MDTFFLLFFKRRIVISDGQPAADNYYGTEAEADLRGIKKEYTARGIEMFAASRPRLSLRLHGYVRRS